MKIHKIIFDRGTGLGNRLFPWARAIISAKKNEESWIPPIWTNVRLAPLRARNVKISNLLFKFFLINNFKFNLKSIQALWVQKTIKHNGLKNYFADLYGEENLLYSEFCKQIKLSKPASHFKEIAKMYPIMLNIRTGNDFAIKYETDFFTGMITQIKKSVNSDIAFGIITDSQNSTLIKQLKEKGCFVINNKKAVDDLYLLSLSAVIIGSGGSSFCCWPAYFKKIPLIIQENTPHEYFRVFNDQNKHLFIQRNRLTEENIKLIKFQVDNHYQHLD